MLMKRVTAYAPATVANVAVGFDLLGFAFDVIGDTVTVAKSAAAGVRIGEITWTGQKPAELPRDAAQNTATLGLLRLLEDQGADFGFDVTIKKGIPLGSGMGGSAASAVAAIVAASRFFATPLSRPEQLRYALMGETLASGSAHADNVAPCIYGGLTLSRSLEPLDIVEIPVPDHVWTALVHPRTRLDTKIARGVLKPELKLRTHVAQSANLAGFLAGCFRNDLHLIKRSLADLVVEPQRAHLIQGFRDVKAAALQHGALGCSISGAGPSVFAWADSAAKAREIGGAMAAAFVAAGVEAEWWAAPISRDGARCLSEES
jgi:homoserine kinase